jgi:two-component sensor histidine kinase
MDPDYRDLFHRLNNQLGIILAHAELLEAKATDDATRTRAAQVVASTLDAMATARELRQHSEPSEV